MGLGTKVHTQSFLYSFFTYTFFADGLYRIVQGSHSGRKSVPTSILFVSNRGEQIVHSIYAAELQLNKAIASDTESALVRHLSINNDTVSTNKCMINGIIFILLVYRPFMAMSHGVPLMVLYLNLFALPDHPRMLGTSIVVTKN